jgi:hypothetical protein
MILGSVVFVAAGFWMINDPDGSRRYSPEFIHVMGFICVAFFGLCAVAGLGMTFKRSKLIIEPEGLTYEWLRGRNTWAWRDVGAFEIEGQSGKTIRFDVTGEAGRPTSFSTSLARRPSIPGGWTRGIKDVCAELNAARERWR